MSRNGSGTYTWPAGSFNPAVSGASATPGDWNTGRADLETAVSNSIASDGQTTVTANLPMATFKHTGVGNASNRTDYASAAQIADGTITYAIDTGTADLYAIAPTPTVDAYRVGQTFHFKVINANATTTPTLAVSGLATPGVIKWPNAAALVAGDLPANALVSVTVASTGPAVFHLQTVAVPGIRSSILTTRGDLIVEGATVPQRLGLGTVGKVLTSDGTDAVWAGPYAVRVQTFSANGTYTPNANMLYCQIECVGAGGGGAGVASPGGNVASGAGGGGSGGFSRKLATAATIGASQTVTIGAAGAAGSAGANNGSAGSDTSVGTICIGKGGSGGLATGQGGAGGVAGTSDVASTGSPGTNSAIAVGTAGGGNWFGANGGSTAFGGGGIGGVTATGGGAGTAAGGAATGFGGGGGGGAAFNNGAAAAGGAGTAGYVVITEYCKA